MHVPNEIRPIVRREHMPQLDVADYIPLLVALGEQNPYNNYTAGWIDPHSLFFHQDVDPSRAQGLPQNSADKPVLISRDLALFDGNHRAWRKWQNHELVQFVRLNVLFADMLPWLRKWSLDRVLNNPINRS